eukprot:scaffold8102_cov53-Attheya_sp.AAC.4
MIDYDELFDRGLQLITRPSPRGLRPAHIICARKNALVSTVSQSVCITHHKKLKRSTQGRSTLNGKDQCEAFGQYEYRSRPMRYLRYLVGCSLFLANFSVKSYAPNPKAIHPDGRLPSIRQAKNKLSSVHHALDDQIILIDGNNIRNVFGYQEVSAVDLATKLSSWSPFDHDPTYNSSDRNSGVLEEDASSNVVCVWDGGSEVISSFENSTLQVFSGPDGNADDILVKCCAFLSKVNHPIVVFTSDANLANRCQMQASRKHGHKVDFRVYHSVYLYLLLGGNDLDLGQDESKQTFAPDWERQERRRSVEDLQLLLLQESSRDECDRNTPSKSCVMRDLNDWINGGMDSCKIGQCSYNNTKDASKLKGLVELHLSD